MTNLWNVVVSLFWTAIGVGAVWYAVSEHEAFGWIGLGAIAYGLYGFYRVIVHQSRR